MKKEISKKKLNNLPRKLYKIFILNDELNSEIYLNPIKKIYKLNQSVGKLTLENLEMVYEYKDEELILIWDKVKSINFEKDFLYLRFDKEFFTSQYSNFEEFLENY